MNTASQVPRLAPPGAGLPKIEHFFANLMIHWKARRTNRAEAEATFAGEHAAIVNLLRSGDPARFATPVLVKRLPGLEDSSRYWSLLMTLDHLRIVNAEITRVIAALCNGNVPPEVASTAAVKPSEDVDKSVIARFGQGCSDFERTVAAQAPLTSQVKYAHPWFGPMDAAAWHFMAGFHMRLHRKQVELILAGLTKV